MWLALLLLAGAAIVYGPMLWARWVLKRYSYERKDFPGSGGEFATHLLNKSGVEGVAVEMTEHGDHYDPQAKRVRLSEANLRGRSLTAITVAAHEVGHAIQDHSAYAPLVWRGRLVQIAQRAERLGSLVFLVLPFVGALTRSPTLGALMFAVGLMSMAAIVIVHLVTLPVELDASFRRALPMMRQGGYVDDKDMRAAKRILRACALTYVASSLSSLFNIWRWFTRWRR